MPPDDWRERERQWQRRLGRLRLGAEPISEQLARYRRVTWALTAVPLAIGLMFVGLFWAFDRPDVGAIVAVVLIGPMVAWAWVEDALLRLRAARYERERREFAGRSGGPQDRPSSPG